MSRGLLLSRFTELYPVLRSRLRRRLGSQDLADEALNETWLRLSKGGDVGLVHNAAAYLARVAVNIAIDKKRAEPRLASADEIENLLAAPADSDPERTALARFELEALARAIDKLPPRRRAILAAARIEGRSCRDIAASLGLSTRSVEMELKQALEHCADFMATRQDQLRESGPRSSIPTSPTDKFRP